jgi:hypothetical protein
VHGIFEPVIVANMAASSTAQYLAALAASHLSPFLRSVIHDENLRSVILRPTGSANLTDDIKTMIATR